MNDIDFNTSTRCNNTFRALAHAQNHDDGCFQRRAARHRVDDSFTIYQMQEILVVAARVHDRCRRASSVGIGIRVSDPDASEG